MRTHARLWLALAAATFAGGCAGVVGVHETMARVYDARPLIPEEWYEDVHLAMERCTGMSRPYLFVQWFVVPAHGLGKTREGWEIHGVWSWTSRIYLDQRHTMNLRTVAHELLHYITRMGDDHPQFIMWLEECLP